MASHIVESLLSVPYLFCYSLAHTKSLDNPSCSGLFRITLQRSLLRKFVGDGVVLAGNVPEANVDVLFGLFGGDRFVQVEKQV